MVYSQLMNDSLGSGELYTANNIGGGSGLPATTGVSSPLESEQLTKWLLANRSGGVESYTDKAMWREFISGPAWQGVYGRPLTRENYRNAAKAETSRLLTLGFVQATDVKNATLIYESYGRAAGETFSYFPITEEIAEIRRSVADMYSYEYILDKTGENIGNIVKSAGNKLEDLGEVVTNPLTLPAVAVLAVIGLLVFVKVS